MKSRSKKSPSRNKMRVATAFTGAAAFAAAFTPAAAIAGTQRPYSPIRERSYVAVNAGCPKATSIHVATSTGGSRPNATSVCFSTEISGATVHYSGTVGNYFTVCPGMYSGYISGVSHSGNGTHFKDTFKKGNKFAVLGHNGPIKNFALHISAAWLSGTTEKC
jgi:hypothetical protein